MLRIIISIGLVTGALYLDLALARQAVGGEMIGVVPKPASMKVTGGREFELTPTVSIVHETEIAKKEAEFLAECLRPATGLFYGVQSLRQLLPVAHRDQEVPETRRDRLQARIRVHCERWRLMDVAYVTGEGRNKWSNRPEKKQQEPASGGSRRILDGQADGPYSGVG